MSNLALQTTLANSPFLMTTAKRMSAYIFKMDMFTTRWAYIGRVVLAATIALGMAYGLQLETPYSAATTVFLVAHPIQGITLSKGAWRIIGSILGAVVAVVLMDLFAQAPALFIFGFALWLGLCVGVASLLRHFRSYGAVVAGYTIGLVIYGAIDAPDLIFDHAVGRVSVVTLGVVALSLTTALLSRRTTSGKLRVRLGQLAEAVGRLTATSLDAPCPSDSASLITQQHALVSDLHSIDDLLEFSAAEAADVALRAGTIRQAMAALFAVVVATGQDYANAGSALAEEGRSIAHKAFHEASQKLRAGLTGSIEARHAITDLRRQLDAIRAKAEDRTFFDRSDRAAEATPLTGMLADLIVFDRLDEMAEDFETAITALIQFSQPAPPAPSVRFRFQLDPRGAVDNGIRALLAVLCAGTFWIASAWTFAPLTILLVAPFCGLLAMTPNPVLASAEFTKGIVVAVFAGFICSFGLLPHISGFPLLILTMAPFWIAGLYATTNPKTGPAGTAYLLTFMTLVGPTNPMLYDIGNYLNSSLAFVLSGFCTLLSFRIFFPRVATRDAIRIGAALQRDTQAILVRPPRLHRLAFEHLQHQRLVRIASLLKGNATKSAQLISESFVMLHVSRATRRIHEIRGTRNLPTVVKFLAWHGLQDLHRYRRDPPALAAAAGYTAELLIHLNQARPR